MLKRLLIGLGFLLVAAFPAKATTYTTCGGLALPIPGDPSVSNIWGTILNTNTSLIDSWNGSALTLSVAGSSNVVLTGSNGAADQTRSKYFNFTGTLTGNINVLFAAGRCGSAIVHNGTSGAFTLSMGVNNGSSLPAGTTYTVPQGGTAAVYSDGTNVVLAATPNGIGAAKSGANSDITSLSGLTTPLSASQGGFGQTNLNAGGVLSGTYPNPGFASIANGTMLANESGSSAAPIATALPVLHAQMFTSSGTFTIPATANSSTVFKFTLVGGGGGGGCTINGNYSGGGGGSGGDIVVWLKGFTASSSVTLSAGTSGAGGTSTGTCDGSAGGNTTLVYSATTVVSATGGSGGCRGDGGGCGTVGAPGSASVNVGSSGLTSISSVIGGAQAGVTPYSATNAYTSGSGGSNTIGTGGTAVGGNATGSAGSQGGGGAGANSLTGGGSHAGGAGGTGAVLVEWAL